MLDERVPARRKPSSEARPPTARARPEDDVAFVGGIDLCHGRGDDRMHRGDPQAVELNPALRGPSAVARPAARDPRAGHRRPGALIPRTVERPDRRSTTAIRCGSSYAISRANRADPTRFLRPVPTRLPPALRRSKCFVRTRPSARPSPLRQMVNAASAVRTARPSAARPRLIYLEDQYLWSSHAAETMAKALRRAPELHLIAVVPRLPEQSGRMAEDSEVIGRRARPRDPLRRRG